jgi:hypothetical protein
MNGKIVKHAPYGRHIDLICSCGARYHTKNIGFVGARSIFSRGSSCDCPASELRPLTLQEIETELLVEYAEEMENEPEDESETEAWMEIQAELEKRG